MRVVSSAVRNLVRVLLLGAVLCVALLPCRALAQNGAEQVLRHIESACNRGDGRVMLDVLADRVEVRLLGSSTLFSRGQAVYVLEDFFRQYPPRKCDFKESTRTDESWFVAGEYWYGTAPQPFGVYVVLRQKGEHWELREFRIEEQPQR